MVFATKNDIINGAGSIAGSMEQGSPYYLCFRAMKATGPVKFLDEFLDIISSALL